jgi:hypothetical protein
VIKYTTYWGRTHYDVLRSTSTYVVFPALAPSGVLKAYCTCPAFAYAVLMTESHILVSLVLISVLKS